VGALVKPSGIANHSKETVAGFQNAVFHSFQVKSIQGGMHARDRSWYRLHAFHGASRRLEMSRKWVSVFLGNSVEASEVDAKLKRAIFLLNKEDWVLHGESGMDG